MVNLLPSVSRTRVRQDLMLVERVEEDASTSNGRDVGIPALLVMHCDRHMGQDGKQTQPFHQQEASEKRRCRW